jgi:hypothetical protein
MRCFRKSAEGLIEVKKDTKCLLGAYSKWVDSSVRKMNWPQAEQFRCAISILL